ncbi:MAG: AbrB/MazE/SpoVT family DNA-binding domain-containing protein [Acidobacteriota bacterium]
MSTKAATITKGAATAISRIGRRRQVVIPEEICEALGLHEGGLVEITRAGKSAVIKPIREVDADDTLNLKEAALVRSGERQIATGESLTLDELERSLDRQARKRRRKTA